MESLIQAVNNSLPLFITIGLVIFLRYKKILPENTNSIISPILFKLVLPFFVFNVLYNTSFSKDDLGILGVVAVLNIAILFVFISLFKLLKYKDKITGTVALAVLAYSAGPVTYPFVQLNFDSEVFSKVVVIDIVLFVSIMVFAPIIGAIFDPDAKANYKNILKTICTDVVLITVGIVFLLKLFNLEAPEFVTGTADYIGRAFLLLVTIFMACALKKPDMKRIKLVVGTTFARTLVAMLGGIIVIILFSPSDAVSKALLLTLFAPISSYGLIYTDKHNLDSDLLAQLVVFGRIVGFSSYPILIALLL